MLSLDESFFSTYLCIAFPHRIDRSKELLNSIQVRERIKRTFVNLKKKSLSSDFQVGLVFRMFLHRNKMADAIGMNV